MEIKSIIPVYELRVDDEKGKLYIIRHKHPKFTVELQDDCTPEQLGAALKKAGEWAIKRGGHDAKRR